MLENGFTPDGSGPGALALLPAQLFPRFHGQHSMTAKPSTMQLRRCIIPSTSHSQMIHSSKFEMMPRKAETFCSYRTQRLQHSGARGDLDFSSSWTKVRASGGDPWIRRELRWRDCLRRGALPGQERVALLPMCILNMLQLVVVLRRLRRRPPEWTPTPSATAGQRMRSRRGSRQTRFVLYDISNPTGFVKERTVKDVGRVAGALVGLPLPFDSCNIAPDPDCPRSSGIQCARGPDSDDRPRRRRRDTRKWWVRNVWGRE